MITAKPVLAAAVGLFALTACTEQQLQNSNPTPTGGAVLGAAGGALLGSAIGGNTRGALIGAAAGAGAGALIGRDLQRQKRELDQAFANGRIEVIDGGNELIVRMPQDILFPVSGSAVSSPLQADLLVLADNLNRYPNSLVVVVGHTDSTGSADYNQALSERRANSVAAVLRSGGVAPARVRAIGVGENEPIATNQTPEGRAQNRRVDIKIRPTTRS